MPLKRTMTFSQHSLIPVMSVARKQLRYPVMKPLFNECAGDPEGTLYFSELGISSDLSLDPAWVSLDS